MKMISTLFGPFNQDEIEFYMESTDKMNGFQKDLIFNLFYKYFGDPVSIKAINKEQYVKLLIAAKRILQANSMVLLPYIISGKITRLVSRKSVNKKEHTKLISSPLYTQIQNKYRNEKIERHILSMIATILSSDFVFVDYYDQDISGKPIEVIGDLLIEELLIYITLI